MPAQPAMSEERVKRIEITVSKDGKPHIAADLRAVTIDRTKDEEVIWVSELPFRIDFRGDSPFYESQFNEKNRRSGLVRRGVISSRDAESARTWARATDSDSGVTLCAICALRAWTIPISSARASPASSRLCARF